MSDKISRSGRKESNRTYRGSTKVNSDFKWKTDITVVGALEIVTEPDLDIRATMELHKVIGYEQELEAYHKVWKKLKLKNEFVKAWDGIPPKTFCCGMVTEQDETIKQNTKLLNDGWVKSTNEKLLKEEGFKIDVFVWSWTNVSGKSETIIPMIRFHSLPENMSQQ